MSLERPPSQPGAHTAFKSTLANLSAGLATLDEGEYLQWGGNKSHISSSNLRNSHKKVTLKSRERSSIMRNGSQNNSTTIEANTLDESVLLKKTIDHSSPLEKRVKVNKVKDLLEMSKADNNSNNENIFKDLFEDVGVGAVQPIKARAGSLRGDIGNWKQIKSIQYHLGIDASSDLMVISDRISGILGSCNRSDLEVGAQTPEVNETIRQSFSGSLRRSGKFRPWRADTAEKNERKTSVVKIITPNETKESQKGGIVLPKFNIGGYLAGESIATKASNQGDGLSFGYSAVDLKNAEPGWAFSGQWRARKTLYSFKPKENSRRILRERSLEKARESSPSKTKKEGERSFSSYEKILKEMESAEELKNRGHIGKVVWDESDLYKVQKTETQEMAEKFFLDQNKVGVFPTLTPKLPAKRDFVGVRKHLLPFRAKDRVLDEILKDSERTGFLSQDEFGKSLRDTEPRKDAVDQQTSRKKRLNSTVVSEEQQKIKAQTMLEERMKLLEEKYTRIPEPNKETISPRESAQDLREMNKSMIEESSSSNRKKRIPGLSVDSIEAKKKLRGLRNILKLIK